MLTEQLLMTLRHYVLSSLGNHGVACRRSLDGLRLCDDSAHQGTGDPLPIRWLRVFHRWGIDSTHIFLDPVGFDLEIE
jgi:hypothetical protein